MRYDGYAAGTTKSRAENLYKISLGNWRMATFLNSRASIDRVNEERISTLEIIELQETGRFKDCSLHTEGFVTRDQRSDPLSYESRTKMMKEFFHHLYMIVIFVTFMNKTTISVVRWLTAIEANCHPFRFCYVLIVHLTRQSAKIEASCVTCNAVAKWNALEQRHPCI
eukprot:6212108-Pleurochrysis_carterae.AAC.7